MADRTAGVTEALLTRHQYRGEWDEHGPTTTNVPFTSNHKSGFWGCAVLIYAPSQGTHVFLDKYKPREQKNNIIDDEENKDDKDEDEEDEEETTVIDKQFKPLAFRKARASTSPPASFACTAAEVPYTLDQR
jgi:hypothetical protein